MFSTWFRSLAVLTCLFFVFAAPACSDDDERDFTPGGGDVPGGSQSGDDPDAGDDAGDDDVEDDAGDAGELDPSCDLEVQGESTDTSRPCCFDDQDCHDSNAPGAGDMRCYYSVCEEGGEGTCRIAPESEQHCWDDLDCPEGYRCPLEQQADAFACGQPQHIETWTTCVEIDDE